MTGMQMNKKKMNGYFINFIKNNNLLLMESRKNKERNGNTTLL